MCTGCQEGSEQYLNRGFISHFILTYKIDSTFVDPIQVICNQTNKRIRNKLASLEATLVRNSAQPATHSLNTPKGVDLLALEHSDMWKHVCELQGVCLFIALFVFIVASTWLEALW